MEIIRAKRTTPYGVQLEDDSYRNASEPVRKFIKDKLPADLEIQEIDKGMITKVRILARSPGEPNEIQQMSKLKNQTNARIAAQTNAVNFAISLKEGKETVLQLQEEFLKFIEQ